MLNYRRDTAPLLPKIVFIATSFPSLTELDNLEVLQMEPESKAPTGMILFFPYTITTNTITTTPWTTHAQGLLHKESSLQAKEDLPKVHEKLQTQKPQGSQGKKKKKRKKTYKTLQTLPRKYTLLDSQSLVQIQVSLLSLALSPRPSKSWFPFL